MNQTKKSIAEGIHNLKRLSRDIIDITYELTTPLPVKPLIIEYGPLKLDQTSGLCWYNNKRYKFNKGKAPYIILNELMRKYGNPVTYDQFRVAIKSIQGNDVKTSNTQISNTIKDMRRKFGINTNINPEVDLFIPTGNGYRLMPQ